MPPDAVVRANEFAIEQPADVDVSEDCFPSHCAGLIPPVRNGVRRETCSFYPWSTTLVAVRGRNGAGDLSRWLEIFNEQDLTAIDDHQVFRSVDLITKLHQALMYRASALR
jgi:hypothetical protein